jgi:hypothetical protein
VGTPSRSPVIETTAWRTFSGISKAFSSASGWSVLVPHPAARQAAAMQTDVGSASLGVIGEGV